MLRKLKTKLFVSVMAVVIALTIFIGASYAWLTLSTNPEVAGLSVSFLARRTLLVSTNGTDFSESIDLSQNFANVGTLRPVSTWDGLHWYIPTYNTDGSLKEPKDFILDDGSDGVFEYGNKNLTGLAGQSLQNAESGSYYVFTEFWVKSDQPNGCLVRISIPHEIDESELGGWYGSYVLGNYIPGPDGTTPVNGGKNVESVIRVGFYILAGESLDEDVIDSFYIYEPNADLRSEPEGKEFDSAGEYVLGYTFNKNTFKDGTYFPTAAVKYNGAEETYVAYAGDTALLTRTMYLKTGADTYKQMTYEPDKSYVNESALQNSVYRFSVSGVTSGNDYLLYLPTYGFAYEASEIYWFEYEEGTDGEEERIVHNVGTEYLGGRPRTTYYLRTGEDEYKELVYSPLTSDELYTSFTVKDTDIALIYSRTSRVFFHRGTAANGRVAEVFEKKEVPKPPVLAVPDTSKLFVQKQSKWNTAKASLSGMDSTCVGTFGRFLDVSSLSMSSPTSVSSMEGDVAGSNLLLDLPDDKPVKIRLFIWMEGQDVDCWNDVAAAEFRVNIELAGEDKIVPDSPTETSAPSGN